MERRRASSVSVNASQVDGGPGNPRHADCRASWCRRRFWKQGPVCGLCTVVEHAAGIDGEPEEGTGQAGSPLRWFVLMRSAHPPSSCGPPEMAANSSLAAVLGYAIARRPDGCRSAVAVTVAPGRALDAT